MIVLVVGNIAEIMAGHPDHEASFTEFGPITEAPAARSHDAGADVE